MKAMTPPSMLEPRPVMTSPPTKVDRAAAPKTATRLPVFVAHAGSDDHAHRDVVDAHAEGEQGGGGHRFARDAADRHAFYDVVNRQGDCSRHAHVQGAAVGVALQGFGRGVGQETVEHDEGDEADDGCEKACRRADGFGAFGRFGQEVADQQYDDGAGGHGERRFAHPAFVLREARDGGAGEHEQAEQEGDDKTHGPPMRNDNAGMTVWNDFGVSI